MPRIPAKQLGGLILSVDAKKMEKFLVLDGANFLLDAEGPRSAFGFDKTYRDFADNAFVHSENLGGTTFYFVHTETSAACQVFTFDWANRQYIHHFNMPKLDSITERRKFPWTTALVGGKYYMCHLAFGVWEYVAGSTTWTDITANIKTDLGGIADVFFITESAGRMIAVITGFTAWSAIDVGDDFVPSTTTGAGAQSLALVGTPTQDYEYKGLYKVAEGFLTATEFGVMRSTIIQAITVFRHDVITRNKENIPFNQKCAVELATDIWIFLTRAGLYQTDGRTFKVWQPLMSEFLKLSLLNTFSRNILGQVQLHYDDNRQWFFISYNLNATSNLFTRALASYIPRGEWGSFDSVHRGFVTVDQLGDNSSIGLGFVDTQGKICKFADGTDNLALSAQADSLQSTTLQNEVFYGETHLQKPVINIDPGTGTITHYASSTCFGDANNVVHDYAAAWSRSLSLTPAWYELYGADEILSTVDNPKIDDVDVANELEFSATVSAVVTYGKSQVITFNFIKQLIMQTTLNATIDIGLFRLTDELNSQQFTQITEVALGMEDANTGQSSSEDYMGDYPTDVEEDWLTFLPETAEDWGFALSSNSNYTQKILGTLDGYTQFEDQLQDLVQVKLSGKTKFCSCDSLGLYQRIQINATELGESFHMKDVEITAALAGRL